MAMQDPVTFFKKLYIESFTFKMQNTIINFPNYFGHYPVEKLSSGYNSHAKMTIYEISRRFGTGSWKYYDTVTLTLCVLPDIITTT